MKYFANSLLYFAGTVGIGYYTIDRLAEGDYKTAAVAGFLDLGALVCGIASVKMATIKESEEERSNSS